MLSLQASELVWRTIAVNRFSRDFRINNISSDFTYSDSDIDDEVRYHPLVYAYRRGALRRAYYDMGQKSRKLGLEFWNSEIWNWLITHLGCDHFFPLFDSLNDLISLMLVNKHTNYFLKRYHLPHIILENLTYHLYPFSTLKPRFNNITYIFKEPWIYKRKGRKWDKLPKDLSSTITLLYIFSSYRVRRYKDPLTKYAVAVTPGHIKSFARYSQKEKKDMIKRFYLDGLHYRRPTVYGSHQKKGKIGTRTSISKIEKDVYFKPQMSYYLDKNLSKHTHYRNHIKREVKTRKNCY